MDLKERKELTLRNSAEIVEEGELDEILREKDEPRCYVGYETSGPVHLGHWISVRKLLDLQKAGFQPVVLWADLHTFLNRKGEEDWIESMIQYWQATFEALGLEAEYVHGRDFEEETLYFHDILRMAKEITINRGTRAMSEVARDEENPYISQIIYPLMQALDIEHLDLDLAVAGIDQRKIHMLARDKLPKLGYDKPTCLHWPMLASLSGSGEKMSSSKKKTMFPLHADPSHIREVVQEAYCPSGQVEDNPVLQIAKFFVFGGDRDLEVQRDEEYGGDLLYSEYGELEEDFSSQELHPQDLKDAVAEEIVDRLSGVRERFKEEPELLQPLEEIGHEKPDYI
ncbi:MAG: tyrosine--tRNA ligase [Candidatus Nanohaloarchaeota archaeon QJJ-7]|nr:tyrosine--tRNA ligase [Candidatus Nanohaloarchaeota archaeon QJJ-7]